MAYSDWQHKRIRDALRAYHQYGGGSDGERFNWKDVAEAIDEYAGEIVPPERLRQFVEGINAGNGGRKYPVPMGARIEAIVRFVTHEDLNLLSEDELREFVPQYQAPLRLLEYLDQGFDDERILPPEKITGTYRMELTSDDEFAVSELTLERPLETGLIEVRQTDDYYEPEIASTFDELSLQHRNNERNARVKFGGWAILTPEDNLFLFLKNERNGRNRYYFTMASDLNHNPDVPVTQFVFLNHDYPLESGYGQNEPRQLLGDAVEVVRSNLSVFMKVA